MIGVITARFNWSGKHVSSNDLFTMDCTTEKLYWKIYLSNQQEPDQASSFFYLCLR